MWWESIARMKEHIRNFDDIRRKVQIGIYKNEWRDEKSYKGKGQLFRQHPVPCRTTALSH